MEFLNRVRPLVCHDLQDVQVVTMADASIGLQCQSCRQMLPVYAYVDHVAEQDPNEACRLAELYHAWTGDDTIPVRFPLIGIDGLLPKVIEKQTLGNIAMSVRLLKWLNAPFTQDAVVTSLDSIHLKDLIHNCLDKIKTVPTMAADGSNPEYTLIMKNLFEAFESSLAQKEDENLQLYLDTYVPFVKSMKDDDTLWLPPDDTTGSKPLIGQLQEQLLRSQAIRQLYSMYCYKFDVFHVLVGCFSCYPDMDVIQNWLLDFVIRICRGDFFWKKYESNLHIQHALNVLRKEVTYKRNTDLYYLVKRIRDGEGVECLSENLLKYGQLEKLLSDKTSETFMCFQFPNILFDNHYDQLAFNMGLLTLQESVNRRTGQVQKGTYAKVRNLSNLVKSVARQLHEFDQRVQLPWTDDTLQLFLASNERLSQQVSDVMAIVFPSKLEEETP